MPTRYKLDDDCVPTEVCCEFVGYPHLDADGETQCDNTHFDSIDEAWKSGRRSAQAVVSLAAADVEHAESQLDLAKAKSAHAVKLFSRFLTAERRYQSEQAQDDHEQDPDHQP